MHCFSSLSTSHCHASHCTHHTHTLPAYTITIALPTSHCPHHTAHCTHHTAHITLHTSHISHCTHHTAHITLHTSHCTHHTTHDHHTSHCYCLMLFTHDSAQTNSSQKLDVLHRLRKSEYWFVYYEANYQFPRCLGLVLDNWWCRVCGLSSC